MTADKKKESIATATQMQVLFTFFDGGASSTGADYYIWSIKGENFNTKGEVLHDILGEDDGELIKYQMKLRVHFNGDILRVFRGFDSIL